MNRDAAMGAQETVMRAVLREAFRLVRSGERLEIAHANSYAARLAF